MTLAGSVLLDQSVSALLSRTVKHLSDSGPLHALRVLFFILTTGCNTSVSDSNLLSTKGLYFDAFLFPTDCKANRRLENGVEME